MGRQRGANRCSGSGRQDILRFDLFLDKIIKNLDTVRITKLIKVYFSTTFHCMAIKIDEPALEVGFNQGMKEVREPTTAAEWVTVT